MKRALFLLCCLGLSGVVQSCVDDNSAVYVAALLKPNDECEYEADGMLLLDPNYDPASGAGYVATLRVESQLINRMTDIAADPSAVHISAADVTLTAIDGSTLGLGAPNPFRVPASGFIPSSEDGTPSLGVASVLVVPPAVSASLAGAPGGIVVARIQLIGETSGSLDIETPEFQLAITLRNLCDTARSGCLPGQDSGSWCGP